MPATYLTTRFSDREQVKALGARWDAEARKWFVPDGRDLAPFAAWLPEGPLTAASTGLVVPGGQDVSVGAAPGPGPLAATAKGVPLSQLLQGVSQAVAQAFRSGIWTTAEVLKADLRRGHVYLELAERDAQGVAVAQARGMIWADTANEVVPAFERATGMVLGAGIRLLLRARPNLHPLYGLSLVIDAIDPDYSLGDLEARKREIRERLQREGLWDRNRQLPPPWDVNRVLVVAPAGAAGLGDFNTEAQRLAQHGLCHFEQALSRFQGEGAPREILQALHAGMAACQRHGGWPDVVALIRGGGAVNDLAWLNDHELAKGLCELPVPVFTGIGHERDHTVLDDVAHTRFDTPSKVILGIEQIIVRRAREAQALQREVVALAHQQLLHARHETEAARQAVQRLGQQHLHQARTRSQQLWHQVQADAQRTVRTAAQATVALHTAVGHRAMAQVAQARQQVPARLAEVQAQAQHALHSARAQTQGLWQGLLQQARHDTLRAREAATSHLQQIADGSRQQLNDGRQRSQALVREIAGQGPDKALGRGFAIVRRAATPGQPQPPVTRAGQAAPGEALDIQLQDGQLRVQVQASAPQAPVGPLGDAV